MSLRFIRIKEACRLTGLGRSTIYGLIAEGKFPRLVQLFPDAKRSSSAFVASELEAWMKARVEARDQRPSR